MANYTGLRSCTVESNITRSRGSSVRVTWHFQRVTWLISGGFEKLAEICAEINVLEIVQHNSTS